MIRKKYSGILQVALLAGAMTLAGPLQAHAQDGGGGKVIRMEGSFIEPLQERDSALIADQFRYGFHLKDVVKGTELMLPDLSQGLMDSVEVVSQWALDTVATHGKKKNPSSFDIDVSLVITSFDEGKRDLVPLAVARMVGDGKIDTLVFDPQSVEFFTMPVDTATFELHDIKGPVNYPVTFSEVLPWILGVLLAAGLAVLILFFVRRRRNLSAGNVSNDPPHVVALRKLEAWRGSKHWAPEHQKAFYSGITDTLREYIAARYSFDAMEMTSAEIFKELRRSDVPAGLYEDTKTLFETADLVKFAKAFADDEENSVALPTAVRFVTETYQSDIAADGEAEENVQKTGGQS